MAEVGRARIVSHRRIADGTFRLRVHAPAIASRAKPGQFAMVRLPDRFDPLLARPLAVYDTAVSVEGPPPGPGCAAEATHADFVYAVHGKFTTALSRADVGDEVELWGPLGNGFATPSTDHLLLVAGGVGQTALLALGKERLGVAAYGPSPPGTVAPRCGRATLVWGSRTASLFGGLEDFTGAGIETHLTTMDGSCGHRGTVVDLLDALPFPGNAASPARAESLRIACCGPEAMMAAVARWATDRRIPCEVSLETPMACGIGICFSCVARVREPGGGWDYRRTCVEGPVFDGAHVEWAP